MQSNNGDLYFRAGIDLDGFNAGADAMERRTDTLTSHVVSSAGQMDDAISKIGGAFTRIAGAAGAGAFIKEMFNVRSEMQNTEAMLRVFLGSAEKAASFFKQLQGYAYNNVFEFKDLAAQSAQLLAYGNAVESVIPTLNKLSEIAAGTNVPLEELVSIWNKVKVTDKMDSNTIYSLGAKGIDVRQAIADIKELETGQKMLAKEVDVTGLKFQDLQKIIDHVATDGGMFDGMMQEKMKTLGDSWGLMQDNLTNMFNEIGEQNQGLLKAGMDVGNYLIENYQSVAKVLGTLVVAYGAAKAANIALNIAQKNGTGVTVLDNTVWAIRGNLLKVNAEGGKNITASIRQINTAQKEEIATLKAAITEQEHEEVLRKSRVANLNDILSAMQKARLEQMGLNDTSADYIPIAMSMLDKEQQMMMAKAELSNNNAKYIEALRGVVGMHGEEINSIDDRIEAATKQLALAEKEADAAADTREQLEKKVAIYKDYYEQSLQNINATDLQERQEALETAQSELEAAAKVAESAAEARNTAQKKLNELQTKKNTIAEGADTAATQANATAKNILSIAVGKLRVGLKALWAVMKANPIGAVVTVATSLYAIISRFINKSKEAKEAQDEENRAMAEFHKEVNNANDRLNTLQTALSTATRGSAAYNNALKQVNDMCKEYNVELINTNDNLQTQKEKYDALKTAIEGVTAAKLREQFTTTALQNQANRNEGTMASFKENLQNKSLFVEGFRNVWDNEMKFNTMWSLMFNKAQWVLNDKGEVDDSKKMAAVQDLLEAMRKISGHKIKDSSAEWVLRKTFDTLIKSAQDAKREIERVDDTLKIYENTMNAHKGTVKEETTTLADLNKQLNAQNKIITELERKAKGKGLTKAEEEQLTNARTQKSNIEKKIKNFTGQTTANTNKALDERKKYYETLTKEEAMLIFDAEDARIAALQDGAEKEMAVLQNNFNRQMTELDFERKEIDKKRKEMGLPAINWSETDEKKKTVEQRTDEQKRHALEDAFDRNTKKVFDNEIERQKHDYETYLRWIENVGQDAADRHFDDLIKKGRSFSEFVDGEIARLETKQQSITDENGNGIGLTDAELNYLDNLKAEKANGQKQSYASIEEDMSREIAAASTLAEKLEIINRWLEKIKGNGDSSTSKDDLLWKMSQMRTDLLDEQNTQLNQSFERYAAKRLQTEREFNRNIDRLNTEHREEAAKAMKAEMEQTLQELDTDFLKGVVSTVFKNPSKKNMREAMKTLQSIQNMTVEQFNAQFGTEDYQITEEGLANIKSLIGDVGTEIKKLGQGYTLADAFKEIRDGRIEGDMEKVARGTEYMLNAFTKFSNVVQELSGALGKLADATGNRRLKNTIETIDGLASIGNSIAAGAQSGGWIGALANGVVSILTTILDSASEYEEQQKRNALIATSFSHSIEMLNLQLKDSYDNGFGEKFFAKIADATRVAKKALEEYLSLYNGYTYFTNEDGSLYTKPRPTKLDEIRDSGWELDWIKNARVKTYDANWWQEFWGTRSDEYTKITDLAPGIIEDDGSINPEVAQQFLNEYGDLLDDATKESIQHAIDAKNAYIDALEAIGDAAVEMFGYLGDEARNSLVDALVNGGNAWEQWKKKGSQAIETLGEELMYELFLSSLFDDFKEQIKGIYTQNAENPEEAARKAIEAMTSFFDGSESAMNAAQQFGERWREMADRYGYDIWSNSSDENTMTGSLQNLTEETGGVIVGRMNAAVINIAEGNGILRQSLLVQYEMRNSLQGIQADVATIKQRMNGGTVRFNENMNYGYSEVSM